MSKVNTLKVTLNSIVLAIAPVLPKLAEGETKHSPEVLTQLNALVTAQAASLAEYMIEKSDDVEIISRILSYAIAEILAVLECEAARKKKDN